MRIPLTICGFHLQLRIPQQLNLTIQMFYHSFVDSTSCSGFRKYSCRFRKFAYFSSNFERYNDLGICLWNRKQHRRSNKLAMLRIPRQIWFWPVADSTYNAGNAKFGLVILWKWSPLRHKVQKDRFRYL